MKRLFFICAALTVLLSCSATAEAVEPVVKTGIEVLRDNGFEGLKGKRVGLVTNPSGVDRLLNATVDILFKAPEGELVALYGPEHGVRGDVYAGGHITDTKDEATGLPVYSIRMKSVLPVGKVTARLRSHSLPVYEAGRGHYTVEPTRNGELSLTVSLVNRQSRNEVCTVNDVDAKSPELVSSDIRTDSVLLTVRDEGIGVSWHGIYAADASGVIHYPISFDAEQGTVLFEYPSENWDVYIPDYVGNTLHLAMTFH